MRTKKWFINRIGKRIYRDDNDCNCATCQDILENGLIIRDEEHAYYIYLMQDSLNYRDKKA